MRSPLTAHKTKAPGLTTRKPLASKCRTAGLSADISMGPFYPLAPLKAISLVRPRLRSRILFYVGMAPGQELVVVDGRDHRQAWPPARHRGNAATAWAHRWPGRESSACGHRGR